MRLKQGRELFMFLTAKMKQNPYAFCVFLTLITMLIKFWPGAKGKLELRPPLRPQSISSKGSKVADCFTGSLLVRDHFIAKSEVSIVLYYAPWCARSLSVFQQFEKAAEELDQQVQFISVNCWWIQGECRGSLHFHRFPQIYIHHRNLLKSFLYNGPQTTRHFVAFLKKVMNPLMYLGTKEKVEKFLGENQLTTIAHFDLSQTEQPEGFFKYFILTIKQLEQYAVPMCFGVVSDREVAKLYFLKANFLQVRNSASPNMVTHLDLNSTFENLLRSFRSLEDEVVAPDLHLSGVKSNAMYRVMHAGPTMLTFLSSDDYAKREHYVKKIRQLVIGYQQYSADLSNTTTSAIYQNVLPSKNCFCRTFLNSVSPNNKTYICNVCLKRISNIRTKEVFYFYRNNLLKFVPQYLRNFAHENLQSTLCFTTKNLYDKGLTYADACCETFSFFLDNLEKEEMKNFKRICEKEDAKLKGLISNSLGDSDVGKRGIDPSHIFSNSTKTKTPESVITGLKWKTNRSLEFLTLDFDRHKALSRNLGVSPHVYEVGDVRLGAVIVDPTNEVHHVMSSTNFHLENFIINYTIGILPQSYQTSGPVHSCSTNSTHACVNEVTTETFNKEVLDSQKDVLLLYYVPWCGACSSIFHVFLSLAKILNPSPTVKLARIDAYENELPLHFTAQSYPTIMLFPAFRSSYSIVFPQEEEITAANLLRFLFQNSNMKSSSQILFNLCMSGETRGQVRHEACRKWNLSRKK